jgi:cytochrome c oxidase cbb3-type subunit IV
MNPLWGHLIGVVIVVLMMVFIGIWVWAWLPRHGKVFVRLAQIPMQDAGLPAGATAGDKDATR